MIKKIIRYFLLVIASVIVFMFIRSYFRSDKVKYTSGDKSLGWSILLEDGTLVFDFRQMQFATLLTVEEFTLRYIAFASNGFSYSDERYQLRQGNELEMIHRPTIKISFAGFKYEINQISPKNVFNTLHCKKIVIRFWMMVVFSLLLLAMAWFRPIRDRWNQKHIIGFPVQFKSLESGGKSE